MAAGRHRRRHVGIVGAAALAAAGLAGGTAGGSPAHLGPPRAITVLLQAPHPKALHRLALAQGLSHAQRMRALRPLLPDAAAHRLVESTLTAQGFSIQHTTAWTIDAVATRSTVTHAFGNPATAGRGTTSPAGSAVGEFRHVPAAMAPVTAVVLEHEGPAVFRPRDICSVQCHNGQDYRNAYATRTHSLGTGSGPNGPLTIATIQLPLHGGWNETDLSHYAKSNGLPDPVASGQYQQFSVDSPTVPPASKREGGADEEVDLDQETLLSTAPLANQRAYFDTSASKAAYTDALSQVFADVTQGKGANGGGDPKIAALSTSWGACESEFSASFAFPHDTLKSVGRVLDSLTAAGVTIFAASGDDGIYDCGDSATSTRTAVDYPASAPQVIGVGGTRLRGHGKRARNNGHNWTDSGWTCTSPEVCQGMRARDTGGSGGGESRVFHQPAYQSVGIGDEHFVTPTGKKGNFGSKRRLVPDIALNGDPATGFETYTTDPYDTKCQPPVATSIPPTCRKQPQPFPIGGTSLSAPAAAALFTDLLAASGATSGVGDIHAALYSAYAAHHGAFRDVRAGRNGHQRDIDRRARHHRARELPVTTQKGYDTVTGLGTPLWPAVARYLFDPVVPTPTGSLHVASTHATAHHRSITAHWGAAMNRRNGSAAKSASIRIEHVGAAHPTIYRKRHASATGKHSFNAVPGETYRLTVIIRDLAGQRSTPLQRDLVVPRHDG